jgi:peptidoglycan/LPS O-acetylase OafA/YrhL
MRAIAVISVMVYHLKITMGGTTLLAGGFLGVDLFFVLSGFLITGILADEYSRTSRISITQFYWRRARRILPPMLIVMVCSLPVAWILLLPSELERFALSQLSALAFISNGFWFFELSEYGAQSGLLQPFLHTWSLAIEEQFYLVFPPLLFLLFRLLSFRTVFYVLVVLTILSLIAAQALTNVHSSLSFYFPTSRAWELLAGSLLAFLGRMAPDAGRTPLLTRIVPPLSLAVLIWSFFHYQLVGMQHPGVETIPVILATCGLIWFAAPGDVVTRVLSLGPVVYVGKLSYSLYLWHFPIFAFGRLIKVGAPTALDMAVWVILTFACSILGYYIVEKPFRFRLSPKPFATAVAAALAPVILFYGAVHYEIGLGNRMQALEALYGENEIDNTALAKQSWSLLNGLTDDEEIESWNALRPSEYGKNDLWFERDDSEKVLILGDSLSKDLYNAFTLNGKRFPDMEFARFNLHRKSLKQNLTDLLDSPNYEAADTIIIAPRYYREYRWMLETIIAAVEAPDKRLLIAGNPTEFDVGGAQPIFDWYLMKTKDPKNMTDLNKLAPKFRRDKVMARNESVREIAAEHDIPYLSRADLMCIPGSGECTVVTKDGLKVMYDDVHWTLHGAALFGRRAAETGWLPAG